MSKWLKEPLLHFVILGALIFGAYGRIKAVDGEAAGEIVVSLRQQENLARTFSRTWQRPPTQAELNGLIADFIRQEIAYRESQAMQLDRDDIIIRRRLRQKLEMLTEDVASLSPPTEQELQSYLDGHPEQFRIPAMLSFRHIFFSTDDSPEQTEREALSLLRQLQTSAGSVDIDSVGDRSLLPSDLREVRETELDSIFGRGFADKVREIAVGRWGGPIRSGFGLHLVYIANRIDGKIPELDEVTDQVKREWLAERRKLAIDSLYERLAENYTITIEAPADILPENAGNTGR